MYTMSGSGKQGLQPQTSYECVPTPNSSTLRLRFPEHLERIHGHNIVLFEELEYSVSLCCFPFMGACLDSIGGLRIVRIERLDDRLGLCCFHFMPLFWRPT